MITLKVISNSFIQTDNYIAFGLSGSDSGIQMVGSDVTWTWMNNEGVHAEELDINAYSQVCILSYIPLSVAITTLHI